MGLRIKIMKIVKMGAVPILFTSVAYAHLCDNVFRQADKLIVKPENYNLVVKDKTTFKIFLQNNMDRGIAEISLLADSPAFDFTITPEKMPVPKDQRVFFTVTMVPKPSTKTGSYPINFRLVGGGGRQFKSFDLNMQGGETRETTAVPKESTLAKKKFEKIEDPSRLLQVKPAAETPKIDGAINDQCWKQAAVASNFSSAQGGKAASQTVTLITFNKKSLYFAVYSEDDHIESLSARDTVEINFTPSDSGYPFYSITLPAVGLPNFKRVLEKGSSILYTPKEVSYSMAKGEGSWTAEVSMPFSILKIDPPASPTLWHVRIVRTKVSGIKEISYWSADSSGYNSEEGFGALVINP